MARYDANPTAEKSTRPSWAPRTAHAARLDLLPRDLFAAAVVAGQLPLIERDEIARAGEPAALGRWGAPVLVRSDGGSDEIEAFLRLPGGELALFDGGHGHLRVEV